MVLCNDFIGEHIFRDFYRLADDKKSFTTRKNWIEEAHPIEELTNYGYSDVKKKIDEWAANNGITLKQAS